MSTIAAGTTSGTALVSTGDTSGTLVLQTNGTTPAVTIGTNQVVTLAQPLPVGSGGTGATSLSSVTVGTATNATTATNLAGGGAGQVPYNTGSGTTAFLAAGSAGQLLQSNGTSAPSWVAAPTTSPAGSTGQVQYNNAGAFGALSSGTSGQVLTSAGAGAAPTWVTLGSSGMVYLAGVSGGNASTVDLEYAFSTNYDMYLIVVTNMQRTTNYNGTASLRMLFKFSGSYDTSLNYRNVSESASGSWALNGGSAQNYLDTGINVATAEPTSTVFNGLVYLPNAGSSAGYKKHSSFWSVQNTNGTIANSSGIPWNRTMGGSALGGSGALQGVRFYLSTNEGLTGNFRLYGISNS